MMLRFCILYIFLIFFFIVITNQTAFAENKTVTIPMGASNPHFETEAKFWYSPPVLMVHSGDTVTWLNSDNEIHTVVSGKGVDRGEFSQGKMTGTPDGYFYSEPFNPGHSWSYTFNKAGTFYYFCTIHPWMNGVIVVSDAIPDYAPDAQGNKIDKFPVVKFTQGKEIEADLTWEPNVILTGEQITFVFNFYDPLTSSSLMTSTPYRFVIVQNGTEIFSAEDATQYSGGYKYFVFDKPGPVEFIFENIDGSDLSTKFSTLVFENPQVTEKIPVIQPARNLVLSQQVQILFIGPPVALATFVVIWAKWGDKFRRKKKVGSEEKRSAI